MSDPVAAIAETEARGETAAIFADIRAVYGVGVVNLIWRHLATFPGALPWAWATVRPLYLDGTIAREAAALRELRRLPPVPMLPEEALRAAGIDTMQQSRIAAVLDAYERTNPMALIALAVLRRQLVAGGSTPQIPGPAVPPPAEIPLPRLLRLEEMAPATAALVLRLNGIGAGPDPILASMYRTLAHWPPYLALAWVTLAPLEDLAVTIAEVLDLARDRAAGLAVSSPALPEAQRPAVLAAIERFSADAIARMVILCGTLRQAMPA